MQLKVKLYPGFSKSLSIIIRKIKAKSTVIQQRQHEAYNVYNWHIIVTKKIESALVTSVCKAGLRI